MDRDCIHPNYLFIKKSTNEPICINHADKFVQRNQAVYLYDYLSQHKDELNPSPEELHDALLIKMKSTDAYRIFIEKYQPSNPEPNPMQSGGVQHTVIVVNDTGTQDAKLTFMNHTINGYFQVWFSCQYNNDVYFERMILEMYDSVWSSDYDDLIHALKTFNCMADYAPLDPLKVG